MTYLVTGCAGFIGFTVTKALIERGENVVGIDNLNDYYDVGLKRDRLKYLDELVAQSPTNCKWQFYEQNLADADKLNEVFKNNTIRKVINLAAQAGVRYSLVNPHAYVESNLIAYTNLLEACRHFEIEHLVYASTSSVYGANTAMPFSEKDSVDHPVQFYAATKRANELMAHAYSSLFALPTTGLRFFTVYGPWGRPDMALFLFTKNILEGKPISVFNHGNHTRDFTYIDDIVEGILRTTEAIPKPDENWDSNAPNPDTSFAPFRIFNIGNNNPVQLMDYIRAIEKSLGKSAEINFLPLQKGDVPSTYANVESLMSAVGYKPETPVQIGVDRFITWYKEYYRVS